MSMSARIGAWLLDAPDLRSGPAPMSAVAVPTEAAVIGAADVAAGAGAVVALERAGGSRVAVLLSWGATVSARPAAPALPAARKLASRLTERELPALARGRLVLCLLDEREDTAATQARRVGALLPAGTPLVLALGGPRGEDLDTLLAEMPEVLVAVDISTPLGALALAGAEAAAGPVAASWTPPGAVRRRAALCGLLGPGRPRRVEVSA